MRSAATLIALTALAAGADAPPAPAAGATAATPASAPARASAAPRVVLGVSLVDASDLDVAAPSVTRVLPGSDFDRLGVRADDRIVALNDAPVASVEAFRAAAAALKPGDALRATVLRDGQRVELAGTASAPPRAREVLVDGERLRREVADVRDDVARERIRGDVSDSLTLLQALQDELPRTIAEFKRVYPQGAFRIKVDIDIRSDATSPVAAPLPATPAAPPPAGEPAPPVR